jgi:hypothetical protein
MARPVASSISDTVVKVSPPSKQPSVVLERKATVQQVVTDVQQPPAAEEKTESEEEEEVSLNDAQSEAEEAEPE